jgi:hypothetical protein
MARARAGDRAGTGAGVESAPLVPWSEFLAEFSRAWPENAGGRAEHLTLIGPTKQGKTTLALALLDERARLRGSEVVILATKPRDLTLSRLAGKGKAWVIVREWPPGYGQDRVIYWPRFGDVRTAADRQRGKFRAMLAEVFAEGNRTVYIDEVAYFTEQLRLGDLLAQYWQQGRSQNLVLVAGTQRPRGVPRAMFSECSWFVAFRTADEDELRRVGEIGGTDSRAIRDVIRHLQPHEFVAVQTRTGAMVRSKVAR